MFGLLYSLVEECTGLHYGYQVAVIVVSITAFIFYVSDSRIFDLNGRRVPGPNSNIFDKHSFRAVVIKGRANKNASIAIKEILLEKAGNGHISAANIFGKRLVIAAHPEFMKTVMMGNHFQFPKSPIYDRIRFIFGDGILTAKGAKWQSHRHLINVGFHAEVLKKMTTVFKTRSHRLINVWSQKLKQESTGSNAIEVDLNTDISNLTLGIICETAFGFDFDTSTYNYNFSDEVNTMLQEVNTRLSHPTNWWWRLYPAHFKEISDILGRQNDLINGFISKRQEAYETTGVKYTSGKAETGDSANMARDILDILLMANDPENGKLSKLDVHDNIVAFLAAGHETTATTLMWILYRFCQNASIQQKCHEEVDRVFADAGIQTIEQLSYDDFSKFPYLNAVIKESLRLNPPIPGIGRQCTEIVECEGYKFQPLTNFVLSFYSLHRHPDFWDEPEIFNPDRFLEENIKKTLKHPFQYLPFSAGHRNCIGQRFANFEIIVALAAVLKSFRVSLTSTQQREVRFEETIVFAPRNFKVTLYPR